MGMTKDLFSDIQKRENIEIYLTILIAFVVIILDILSVIKLEVIIAAVLMVLALLALSTLSTRRTLTDLNQTVSKINVENSRGFGIKLEDRTTYRPFYIELEDATKVDMMGYSLIGLITTNLGFLAKKAKLGCHFRILLMSPETEAIKSAEKLVDARELLEQDIRRSTKLLEPILKTGSVELRFFSVILPFSLIIVCSQEGSKAQVEMYAYEVPSSDQPHFIITEKDERDWFEFFRNQFESIWNDASERKTESV